MDGLNCQEWLFLGASSFPLNGCVDRQAVSVGVEGASRGDGEGGGWVSQGRWATTVVSLG